MDNGLSLVIAEYAQLTTQMLALSEAEDWDAWIALEAARNRAFSNLSVLLKPELLNEQSRAILEEALQRNQQMELGVSARHKELTELLHSVRKQQKVSNAYR